MEKKAKKCYRFMSEKVLIKLYLISICIRIRIKGPEFIFGGKNCHLYFDVSFSENHGVSNSHLNSFIGQTIDLSLSLKVSFIKSLKFQLRILHSIDRQKYRGYSVNSSWN